MAARRAYLLDACTLVLLQRTGHLGILESLGAHFDLAVVEEVYDELTDPPRGRHKKAAQQAKALLDAHVMLVCIEVGTPASDRLAHLRAGRTNPKADLGEHASIAWAADNDRYWLLTRDGRSALLALEELRGRVRAVFDFLREAVEAQAIDRKIARAIAESARQPGINAVPPSWWDNFVADPLVAALDVVAAQSSDPDASEIET